MGNANDIQGIAFLADMIKKIRQLNMKLQAKAKTTFDMNDYLKGFIENIDYFLESVLNNEVSFSPRLQETSESILVLPDIKIFLLNLKKEMQRSFSHLETFDSSLILDPFNNKEHKLILVSRRNS